MNKKNKIACKQVQHGTDEYNKTVALRYEILRKPLGLVFNPEELTKENDSFHFICRFNGKLVTCLVLKPLSGHKIRMRQLAVAEDLQKKGFGSRLVKFSESFAFQRGYNEIVLHARINAVRFYEKLGYKKKSRQFIEVTIPHYYMWKVLDIKNRQDIRIDKK